MNTQGQKANTGPSSEPEGVSWQFRFVLIVIVIGVLGLIAKTLGLL